MPGWISALISVSDGGLKSLTGVRYIGHSDPHIQQLQTSVKSLLSISHTSYLITSTMKSLLLFASACLASGSLAASSSPESPALTNLVSFGDSFTDEGRMIYWIMNNGTHPAPGTLLPESNETFSGGYTWPRFVAQKTGAKSINYAFGGATCSRRITNRPFPMLGQPVPGVLEDEIKTFKADLAFEDEVYENGRKAENTVYALWIGTNDLGMFLFDSNEPGTTISEAVECVWEVLDRIYESGGRRFVLFSVPPLEISPLYNLPELGGATDSIQWPDKMKYNITEYKIKMKQYSTSMNTMLEYGGPFGLVRKRWPGAKLSFFDVHGLMMDVIESPEQIMEPPTNVTGYYAHCGMTGCDYEDGSMDSFVWYDELHPSERIGE